MLVTYIPITKRPQPDPHRALPKWVFLLALITVALYFVEFPQTPVVATAGTVPLPPIQEKVYLPLALQAPIPTPTVTPSSTTTSTATLTQIASPTSTPTVGPPPAPSNVFFTNVTTSSITVNYINSASDATDILFEDAI